MLVFFTSCEQADRFANENCCAVFHSHLPSRGNTKAYNLNRWDYGEMLTMACLSAFASGVDQANMQFEIIYNPAYCLITMMQMASHAGRDGIESHVFFATD